MFDQRVDQGPTKEGWPMFDRDLTMHILLVTDQIKREESTNTMQLQLSK